MKLSDLRLFGDRCIARFTSEGFDSSFGTVVAVGPDSLVEVGDEIMFSAYYMAFGADDENGYAKHAVLDQAQVVATVGAKPAVDLPELEPLPPPTDAEQEMFQGAADRAMAEQREKLGLLPEPSLPPVCQNYSTLTGFWGICGTCGHPQIAHRSGN